MKFLGTPIEDYKFLKWSDGNTDNPREFTATDDVSIEAIFVAITDLDEMSNSDVVSFSGNRVVVENATSEINIFNINGQLIAKSNDESAEFVLPMGVYIVQIGNQTKRVSLK